MTIDEFLALKEGDRIENPMTSSKGTVLHVTHDRRGTQDGVWITWDGSSPDNARRFSKHQTAWMHWTQLDDTARGRNVFAP